MWESAQKGCQLRGTPSLGLPPWVTPSLMLCHFGPAGEGKTGRVGKKILLAHRGQAFPEDYTNAQRGS